MRPLAVVGETEPVALDGVGVGVKGQVGLEILEGQPADDVVIVSARVVGPDDQAGFRAGGGADDLLHGSGFVDLQCGRG